MKISNLLLLLIVFLTVSINSFGQPANDNCNNASIITVTNSGFGLGTFISSVDDISTATVQAGESFAPVILSSGLIRKTAWYKFSLATTRSVRVALEQSGTTIGQSDIGFTVYKTPLCLPAIADISQEFTPIAKFGSTYHPCVGAGDYLVQVSSNNNANGSIRIKISVSDSSGALYDHPVNAYPFGVLSEGENAVNYFAECQSIEDNSETCSILNIQDYTKTSWHTFTTPTYFDYLAVTTSYTTNSSAKPIGYKIYKGNAVSAPISSLTGIGSCDTLSSRAYKLYQCGDLQPNTTYSIQLFFEKKFKSLIQLKLVLKGIAPTKAPQPISTSIPVSNQLGVLTNGLMSLRDNFGCNSRHSQHACGDALPTAGIPVNGLLYNLSTFYTFSLSQSANLSFFTTRADSCSLAFLIRVYKQAVTSNCTSLQNSQVIGQDQDGLFLECVPPGNYTLQISGMDANFSPNVYKACLLSNLGDTINASINIATRPPGNLFSLKNSNAYDKINSMLPLQYGISYTSQIDTYGCANTVLPAGYNCDTIPIFTPKTTKAIYREFNVADSGIITMKPLGIGYHKLFKGDASLLATAQNVNTYPDTISGLLKYSECIGNYPICVGNKVCLTPGTYTLAGLGNDSHSGFSEQPTFTFDTVETKHYSPATVEDMGDIIDSMKLYGNNTVFSGYDYFSCRDNAVSINGYNPCGMDSAKATKAIYRQFYLSKPSLIKISGLYYDTCGVSSGGLITLFKGKVSNGFSGLVPVGGKWSCLVNSGDDDSCILMPAGWYTLVSYGIGPNFSNPMQNVGYGPYGSAVGIKDRVTITIKPTCKEPKYNRPFKAAIDSLTNLPFLVEWVPQPGVAYPNTNALVTLPTEHFNCTTDTPFNHPLVTCDPLFNRVAYYVFKTTQVSFVQINTLGFTAEVFDKDVRKDSALFGSITPVQPCLTGVGAIQLCKLQPGTYTLVLFAGDNANCDSVTPRIFIDGVDFSRFDFATKAYDFGVVKPDSTFHNGKPGDVNPINATRAPSNDFFYCTTGAGQNDPSEALCNMEYNPNIYLPGNNTHIFVESTFNYKFPLRNLWYTFVINEGGYVHVKVLDTSGYHNKFAVYESDVNSTLSFSTVVATGQVDSTNAQGLALVAQNQINSSCFDGNDTLIFYRNPCTSKPTRYYVLVQGIANSQIEVSILNDSVNVVQPKSDLYSQASDIGLLGDGTFSGSVDNYACATSNPLDPPTPDTCAPRTLWYKFTSNVTGHIYFSLTENGIAGNAGARLYRQIINGDSTIRGLQYITSDSGCISAGTYYLMLTGCKKWNEQVFPVIKIVEDKGDFCNSAVVCSVTGVGSYTAKAIIDCHTIGTDFGEFGTVLTCPIQANTAQYKTTWFRIDIAGTDTLDVTTFLTSNTNVSQSEIQYRMMVGNCAAMQEGSCVQDSRTQNTYKCLANGSYFIQVFTPMFTNNTLVAGTETLHLLAVPHADTCKPVSGCLATSYFIPKYNCNTDTSVSFNNYSTFGSVINYIWDFDYNGQTSTAVSPLFNYPVLSTNASYNVKLIVYNTACGGTDTSVVPVIIPGRPVVYLANDTLLCKSNALTLNATSWPGATYTWQDGSANPIYYASLPASNVYYVQVSYNGCSSSDTIVVDINPVLPLTINKALCPGDSVLLQSIRGYGETHHWNTGDTTCSIIIKTQGVYYNDIGYKTCVTRDSFKVIGPVLPFAGKDSFVCLSTPFLLNATVPGATGYKWNNGLLSATISISTPGLYYVDITFGTAGCTIRDSITIHANPFSVVNIPAAICPGQSYTLPWGISVSAAGVYSDTLTKTNGCDSIINVNLTIKQTTSSTTRIRKCTVQLPYSWNGNNYSVAGTYTRTLTNASGCDSIATLILQVDTATTGKTIANICINHLPYLWNGTPYSTTGIYVLKLTNNAGCDSTDILILSIKDTSGSLTVVTLCDSKLPYAWNGINYNTSGTFTKKLTNAVGCDSFARLTLVVKPTVTSNTNKTVCTDNLPVAWNGHFYTTSGTYRDTLIGATGCDSIATLFLTVNNAPAIPVITSNAPVCLNETLTLSAYSAYADTYLWTLPGGQTQPGSSVVISNIALNQAGTYKVSAAAKSCVSTVASTNVNVIPPLVVSAGRDIEIHEGDTAILTATSSGQNPGFKWTPNLYFISADTAKSPMVYGVKDILYKLTVTESGKCPATDFVLVKVLQRVKPIFIPNVFSPNNDGVNDTWVIRQLAAYPEATVNVFTRYGKNIFSSTHGYKIPWDGTHNGKKVPLGTYYYLITTNQNNRPLSGWVQILK